MTGYTFNQLFDFTRTTSATFVGSNGLLQTTPASVNLLTFTQEFDNAAWVKAGVTVSANTTIAPDGTTTADKMVEAATTAPHAVYQVFTYGAGLVYAATVYAKKAERNWIYLGADTASAEAVFFDLDTGTVGNQGTGYVGSITNAGNGWYRCSVIITQSTALPPNFLVVGLASANGTPSYAGDGTSGAFIWGAQLELGGTATTYTRNNGGVFPPRFDYDPVTRAPRGILIEEQRTNIATYSDQFDNAAWVKFNATITANATSSPDGAVNADKLAEDASAGVGHLISQGPTLTAAAHTYSVYAKAAERNWICLINNSIANALAFFNLTTGTIGTVGSGATATITSVGNGWYRCSVTFTAIAATNNCHIRLAPSDGVLTYNGVAGNGAFIYGAQLEAGAFATSYIPTVASQVTRTADVCAITSPMFAPWYVQSAGTFVVDSAPYSVGNFTSASATDGSTNNRVQVTSSNTIQFLVGTGGVVQAILDAGTVNGGVPNKVAGAYSLNDFAATINGSVAATDTSGTVPTVSRLDVGNLSGFSEFLNGHIRRITYYPFRASNNQLQVLTT